jgi:DNA polymerase-1
MIHPETGRLHPKYGQIGAWSGRMSCGGPNIQQIPRDIKFRACFIAPPGRKLIIADYSQIELRVAARISGDSRMIAAYKNGGVYTR